MNYGLTTRFQDIDVSTAYRFMLNCSQVAGGGNVPTDLTINGNDAVLSGGMSDADLWANAGHASTIDGTDEAFEMPNSAHAYNMNNGESLIFNFIINAAVLASTDGIFGSYSAGGAAGMRGLSISGTGKLRIALTDGTNTVTFDTTLAVNDSTDHTVTVMLDGTTQLGYIYIDGVLDVGQVNLSTVAGDTTASGTFNFGNDTNAGTNFSYAAKWREIHYLVLSGALSSNISTIAQLLHTRRGVPLSVSEVGI